LIISTDEQNELTDDVIVIPIYSKGVLGPRHVAIRQGVGGIWHDSVLFCEEVSALDRALLVEGPYARPVPDELLREVVLGVRRAIGDAS
jgi:mRNA-degrading endonuclease toxin of MazEF toxin-antitoxin module